MGATSTYTCRQKEEAFGCKAACCAPHNTVPIEAIEA